MKKNTIKILTCFLLGGLMLVSCENPLPSPTDTPEPTPSHTHSWENEWKYDDSTHWHSCKDSTCGEVSEEQAHTWDSGTVTKEPTEEAVGEKTYECTVCDATKTEEVAKLDHTHKFAEEWSKDATHHWHDATCDHDGEITDKAEHSGGTATFIAKAECEVCGEPYGDYGEFDESILVPGDNQELVEYKVNVSTSFETGTSSDDILKEKFTLVGGTEVRARTKVWTNPDNADEKIEFTKSIKLGSKTSEVKAEVPGVGLLSIWVQNGSSGAATQKIAVTDPEGNVTEIEFVGVDGGSPVVKLDIPVKPGTYSIKRVSGTVDIFNMELKSVVEVAPESGFEIASTGKVDFLEGEEFDYSKLMVNKVYGNGRTEDLDLDDTNFSIDASEYKANIPGTYTIKLNYKNYTQLTYDVVVYDVDQMNLGFDAIEKLAANSAAGNGVYFNHSVKEVYDLNEKFDITGLSVSITGKNGDISKDFKINPNDVTITGFDSSTAGKKDVTVTYNFAGQSVSKVFSVYVVDTAPSKTSNNLVSVKVDSSYTGEVGAIVGGYNMFTTIQQALDYIKDNANIASSDRKLIELAPGTYTEKLEITIPYLTIKGSNAETTVIEWDSIYGVADAGGFVHTTDSTATVAIREGAIGCSIEGVTISNWYNSQARMNERNMAIERALALLVQADQFVMKDGQLLGIQDTLELFTGRQYFENVFISGYTDFIFGTNNTTYFKNCTVHTIDTEKDDKGTPGYLTAFKGSNKGASDYITYGAIFDDCDFTADEGVAKGTTAIGRTWGAYAAVAIINSDIGDHISVVGWNSSGDKGNRYVSMNGIKPTDDTVQFVEYNNTGAGAISEAVAGMTYLDATIAAKYSDFAVIFGTTNGAVTYIDSWDPLSSEIQLDENIYYIFNGKENPTGTNYVYNKELTGSIETLGDMTIDTTSGKVNYRSQGDTWITTGAKLIFDVEAGSSVVVTTYPEYHNYTINGVATYLDSFTTYYAEDTTVTIETPSQFYLYSVVIKPNQEAPEAATLKELKVSGITNEFAVGDEFVANLTVEAHYTDGRLVKPAAGEFTIDSSAVNKNEAGSYDVIVNYDGGKFTYSVEYLSEVISYIENDTTWSFKDDRANASENYFVYDDSAINPTLNIGKLTLTDNGQGVVANNNDWLKFNTGAKASFETNAASTLTMTFYQNNNNVKVTLNGTEVTANANGTYTLSEAGVVVIEATKNGYVGKIAVSFTVVDADAIISENKSITFGNQGNYKTSGVDFGGITIADNGGNNSQVKEGSFTLKVKAGATVTINGYEGYTSYTVKVNDGATSETITDSTYVINATEDYVITITAVGGSNYFYGVDITFA